jgi:hypothetical protein
MCINLTFEFKLLVLKCFVTYLLLKISYVADKEFDSDHISLLDSFPVSDIHVSMKSPYKLK